MTLWVDQFNGTNTLQMHYKIPIGLYCPENQKLYPEKDTGCLLTAVVYFSD